MLFIFSTLLLVYEGRNSAIILFEIIVNWLIYLPDVDINVNLIRVKFDVGKDCFEEIVGQRPLILWLRQTNPRFLSTQRSDWLISSLLSNELCASLFEFAITVGVSSLRPSMVLQRLWCVWRPLLPLQALPQQQVTIFAINMKNIMNNDDNSSNEDVENDGNNRKEILRMIWIMMMITAVVRMMIVMVIMENTYE